MSRWFAIVRRLCCRRVRDAAPHISVARTRRRRHHARTQSPVHIHSVRATATLVLTSADQSACHARRGHRRQVWPAGSPRRSLPPHPHLEVRPGHLRPDRQARRRLACQRPATSTADPKDNDRLKSLKPENIAQAWNLFFGDFFSRPGLEVIDHTGSTFTVQRHEKGTTIACDIDRATPHRQAVPHHRRPRPPAPNADHGPLRCPPATHPRPGPCSSSRKATRGQVQVRFDEVEVNPELEDAGVRAAQTCRKAAVTRKRRN